jgi:hypothetical protein
VGAEAAVGVEASYDSKVNADFYEFFLCFVVLVAHHYG